MNITTCSTSAKALLVSIVLALATLPGFALAGGGGISLPTSEVLAHVATVTAFIVAIGAAVLGFIFVAKAFRWARKAG